MLNWEESIKNKKIIFFVAETVPSYSGSGIMAFRYARFLTRYSESVKMVCFNYNNKLVPTEIIDGVLIHRIPYYNKNLLTKILSLPILLYYYMKEAILHKICFLYGTYMPGFESILLIQFLFKKKLIFLSTLMYDDDIDAIINNAPFPLNHVRKYLFSKISLYLAINKEFKDSFEKYYGDNVPIILKSQGIDTDIFHPITESEKTEARRKFNIPGDSTVILSCGLLIERKGYRNIFEILSKIKWPFLYIVAGQRDTQAYHRSSQQEKKEMKELSSLGAEKLANKILFLDTHANMLPVYSLANVFLHGAHWEGLPNVVLEAMACKLPIVLKRSEGLDFVFRNKINVVTYEQPAEIKGCLESVLNDSSFSKKLTDNAYKEIIHEHAYDALTSNVFDKI
jgi:glycosyltransferase involved in cell wall biosynthesis